MTKTIHTLRFMLIPLLIDGCTHSPMKASNNDQPTLKQIYTDKISRKNHSQQPTITRTIRNADRHLGTTARPIYQTLNQQFPFLPNPVMIMYVFPHLTQANTPIPGYSTYFTLYKTHPVALPHEITAPQVTP